MAGHSQFKNIMHRKGAAGCGPLQGLSRQAVARNHGGRENGLSRIPAFNPRLRARHSRARAENMTKDTIERAIKKASAGDSRELRGNPLRGLRSRRRRGHRRGALGQPQPHGLRNVRSYFTKVGGAISARPVRSSFMFDRVGLIVYPASAGSADKVLEAAIEAGADDARSDDEGHVVTCAFSDLGDVAKALEQALGEAETVKAVWQPQTMTTLDEDKAATMVKLISALEDDDDVQAVYSNFDVSEQVLAKLTA
jgi:transcriptional/translational regulatory protein YebC/TACO1